MTGYDPQDCVPQRHQHQHLEHEVDHHGPEHLPVDLLEPPSEVLYVPLALVPVPPGVRDVGVLQGVEDNFKPGGRLVSRPPSDCSLQLHSEDRGQLDSQEDEEELAVLGESEAGVEAVWRPGGAGVVVPVNVPPVESPSHVENLQSVLG